MNPMDTSPISCAPPTKKVQTETTSTPRKSSQSTLASSPLPNIVQRIKYELADNSSRLHALAAQKFFQPNEAITVVNFENGEILVLNAPINQIRTWSHSPIPYCCLPMRNTDEQRTAIDRTIAALSTFTQLPHCAVGIEVDLEKCNNLNSQLQDANNLKQAIWLFLLNEIKFMPPHLRQFFKTDLKKIRSNYKRQQPPILLPVPNFTSSPLETSKVNTFCVLFTFCKLNDFFLKLCFRFFHYKTC